MNFRSLIDLNKLEIKQYLLYTDIIYIYTHLLYTDIYTYIYETQVLFMCVFKEQGKQILTCGDVVGGKILDGVSEVLINLYILICGAVSWVTFYLEIHQVILIIYELSHMDVIYQLY